MKERIEQLKRQLEAAGGLRKADLLLTDPPYNVDYTGKTKDALTIQNDKQEDEEFCEFLTKCFSCADENMNAGAVFYIWHADREGFNFGNACKQVGWKTLHLFLF